MLYQYAVFTEIRSIIINKCSGIPISFGSKIRSADEFDKMKMSITRKVKKKKSEKNEYYTKLHFDLFGELQFYT